MQTGKAIQNDISPISVSETIKEALGRMENHQVKTLPVVDPTTRKLIGQLNIDQLKAAEDQSRPVSDLELNEAVKIYRGQHIFEAARFMLQYEMKLVPVVDDDWTFRGFIKKKKVLESLSHMLNLSEFGSVITIELNQRDLTLSEIVHLIESEGAKILGITVETPSTDKDKDSFKISVKLNLKDVSRVAATLRRYDYTVVTESGNEVYGMDLESRADELIKYLDM